MKDFPSIPHVTNAPDQLFDEGHLWLLEKVDGENFRFRLQQSGLITFGDRSRTYDDPDAVPDAYQHAVRHVRENLDRESLRRAVTDVEDVVFFGEAMHHHTIEYEWERTPSFLGFDVWSVDTAEFRPPDAVEAIFERLGLQPVNVFERERRPRDFDVDSYTVPRSNWYDGPAEGVVIRNKRGHRAKLLHPDYREVDETVSVDATAAELAAKYATRRRFEKLAAKLTDRGRPVTVESLYELALEDILREAHKQLHHSEGAAESETFRSEVAALTREFLEERNGESRSQAQDRSSR
ncbi:RNA ligase family protein [Natrinema halophilum]|uniref:RNA ligase family protein n=1 Tax=Natrinema halophilum TaxID=1699371 RepID=A0A7D5KDC9_9EURY|nr:RNA ligase family protein [Natrinema halophilum]QLG49301.1 RNA ligase family protein [Natrinema halophilum]